MVAHTQRALLEPQQQRAALCKVACLCTQCKPSQARETPPRSVSDTLLPELTGTASRVVS